MADDSDKPYQPWRPISDPVDLKHLGKLQEELGELSAIVGRIIIQGMDERDPETAELNRHALEKEIADVRANIRLVCERFGLNLDFITERCNRKMKLLRRWHDMK